jgi:hypothetical protein
MDENHKAEIGTRVIALIFLGLGWWLAYWIWPAGVMDTPLMAVRVVEALRMLGAGTVGLLTLYGAYLLWI